MQNTDEMCERLMKEFAEKYMEKIFYFCLKKTGDHYEAENLTQDIALQVITALHGGTIPASFSAWVWQIARNRYSVWAARKHNRNESVTGSDVGDYEIVDESDNILSEMIHEEEMSLLRRELAFIKSDYRDIVVAYYIENKSVREIASELSLPENTVKSRLFRAREILKEGMDMAREFGKRSYNPEEITYTNICSKPGELGQPWTLLDPKLNQNVFLACYDNPMTAEELAIEVGTALPYMEDILNHLTKQTLLIEKGDKYETNFPIISREAQEKIHYYFEGIMPQLVALLTENIDRFMKQCDEAGFCYYGPYQSYEEAKWVLLPDFYKSFYLFAKNSPKTTIGNTKRPNNGVWDVVAFEKCDLIPDSVGFHSQAHGFVHYRFGYREIWNRTPANLSVDEARELRLMVDGKPPENITLAEKLVEYGYANKKDNTYIPHVVIIRKDKAQSVFKHCEANQYSAEFWEHASVRKKLIGSITDMIEKMNVTVRDILCSDLPECIRQNGKTVDALLGSICITSHPLGYAVKHAIGSGWLKYDENTSPAIGAFFIMP